MGEIQRSRLLAGAVSAIDELGYPRATVGRMTARARLSRRTFYQMFANCDECFAAVLEELVAAVAGELSAAGLEGLRWRERVRTGVWTILSFFDREPALARVCVVQALRAGPLVLERREALLARLAAVVDEGREESARGEGLTPVTAEGVVGAAFAIAYSRLSRRDGEPLTGLLGELMAMIVLPYLGPAAARRERSRPAPATPAAVPVTRAAAPSSARDPLADVNLRLTHRTARVLEGIAELSGSGSDPSNREVAHFRRCQRPGADLEAPAPPGAPRVAPQHRGGARQGRAERLGADPEGRADHPEHPGAQRPTPAAGRVMPRARSSISSRAWALPAHPARGRSLPRRNDFTTPTKENKVRSTEHTAKPAATPKIGRFATLRGLRQAQGSGASARGLVAAPLVALCVLLALCVGVAQAEPPALIPYGVLPTHQELVNGLAVEGSGDLFETSIFKGHFGESTVLKLDPSGNLLSPPSPFGSAHYSGVAVNPVNGDVYALGEEGGLTPARRPRRSSSTTPTRARRVSSFEVPATRNLFGFFADVQIAADSAGNVYLPVVSENEVLEYSPSGTLLKTFKGSGAGALDEPTGVAIDSSGDLWVANSGSGRIVEFDSSGAPVEVNGKPVEIESTGVWSVALDGHGHVFALVDNSADSCGEKESPCLHLVEYSSEGRQLADVGAGSFGGGETERYYSGLAVNEANGRVYVAAGQEEIIWVFGPPTAPVFDKEFTAEVDASEAKLGALVDPGGIAASYRFEYGPTGAYGSSTPFPEGSVGEGLEARAVWAAASDLAPGSTYHYRVVASNELGTVYGPDQTFTTLTAEQAACPNEQRRGGFAARLPDCRAYELVTPPVLSSSQFDAKAELAFSSAIAADGEAISLVTTEPRPGAPTSGDDYVATRGAGGWIAEDIMPLEPYDGAGCPGYQYAFAYSEQFTKDVVMTGGGSSATVSGNVHEDPESCNTDGRQVVSGEPVGHENLLVRDNATGAYQLVNVTPPGVTPADAHFQAASADLSRVIFIETSPLAEGARYGVENLYEWDEGKVRLVSVLPDGTAVPGSPAAEAGTPEHQGMVSSDGSHVLFTYGGALYDRIDGQRTVQIDEQQGGSGPSGGGSLQAATSDGSEVFFLDESKLTADSTAAAGEPDLYECALPEGASKCELSDLTVAAAGEHADVLRVTPLGGHDSSYVYFVAKGVLASNTREFTNSEGKTVVEGAQAGKENLYLWNGNTTTFIAIGLSSTGSSATRRPRPTASGSRSIRRKALPVMTTSNRAAISPRSSSCTAPPQGSSPAPRATPRANLRLKGAALRSAETTRAEPGRCRRRLGEVFRARHLLTDAGQVFFETTDALVPADTNGELDVYEYEGGHVYLISSGTSSFESNLEGASESGDDVFFRSDQALVPQDNQEGQIVIYDARVGGGFAELSSPPACTTADACRTAVAPQPSVYGAPASQTFEGAGNLAPPPAEATVTTRRRRRSAARAP